MKWLIIVFLFLINSPLCLASEVYVGEVEGVVDPVVAQHVSKLISRAEEKDAVAVVLVIDTPGGLDKSMRTAIKDVLNSRVPVVGFVSPRGARAASAGSFILLSTHVAAMSSGTNVGAAHPVGISVSGEAGAVEDKVTQDAAAYMRSIAKSRGRNVSLAESFVLESRSVTADEALINGVIDIVASDLESLLEGLDGRRVKLDSGEVTLETSEAEVVFMPLSSREEFLHRISNPNIAYLLFMAGLYGIIFELSSPGAILPGVVGVICLPLALWSFQAISVSAAGLALIIFGIALFLLDIKVPSHGLLSFGGLGAFVLGSLMLVDVESEPFVRISYWTIGSVALVTAAFFTIAVTKVIKAMKDKSATGMEGMVGLTGEAESELSPEGTVYVHGELWEARAREGRIAKNRKVKVVDVKNLTLVVEEV